MPTTGFAVPPYDLEQLGERMERLVRDPARVLEMGAAARSRVETNFTWDVVAQRGLGFYRELLAPDAGRSPVARGR